MSVSSFLAASIVALASGLVGSLVLLRNQVFTGDALSHVAFTGALAAFAAGAEPLLGLFGATVAVGLGMALLGGGPRARDVVVGTVFAWVLGLGALFLSLYSRSHGASTGPVGVSVLFGSIYSITGRNAVVAVLLGLAVAAVLAAVARPLLFASVDPDVAASRGVPVRTLGLLFLALVAVTVAEAVQVVGALLCVGLIVTPAAAVQRRCSRPLLAVALSGVAAVACLWAGLLLSNAVSTIPPSVAVIAVAFAVYTVAAATPPLMRRARALRAPG